MTVPLRLVFVYYGLDYRAAVGRLDRGAGGYYYGEDDSLADIRDLARRVEAVTVIGCVTGKRYDEAQADGVRAIGGGPRRALPVGDIVRLVRAQRPTHLVVQVPLVRLLLWSGLTRLPTLAVLADSFVGGGWRRRLKRRALALALNQPSVAWVANHNLPASRALADMGVWADKIIPWDVPPTVTPDALPVRDLCLSERPWALLYVGAVGEAKGVGDAVRAVAALVARGRDVQLSVVGAGDLDAMRTLARALGIADRVAFAGLVPNAEIIPRMRQADVVLVPSRHEYSEAFPFTIYEALCARTPLVASDHPMFVARLTDGVNAVLFPAGDALGMAAAIERVLSDAVLYRALSAASLATWQRLQLPVKWPELIQRWVFDTPANRRWLFEHRLTSGRYDHLD